MGCRHWDSTVWDVPTLSVPSLSMYIGMGLTVGCIHGDSTLWDVSWYIGVHDGM